MGDDAGPVVAYEEVTAAEFGVRAARTFTVEQVEPGVLLLGGPCPRCDAVISIPIFDRVFRYGGGSAGEKAPRYETVVCTCDEPHPGRPESRVGCGAFWAIGLREGPS
ncbi:hypothetical protein NE236_32985 [Actinoallomurus purpureus]|uniref:hypothetical protein n=1 Tax=Actinoallomurus purpureus TaxID=478114 RepID=UPI002092E702|nr:hypothetical protein [Actinoallomurus purpureus]MCO6009798.1 hypothetical protein [Actinoallomurus purpureus]